MSEGFKEINELFIDPAFHHWEQGEYEEALWVLQDGLRETDEDGYIALNYGWLLYDLGRLPEAREKLLLAQQKLQMQKYRLMADQSLETIEKEMGRQLVAGGEKYKNLVGLEVDGLFGQHNYKIKFNQENGLSILLAPNGYGKTTILCMVDSFFAGRFNDLLSANFSICRFCFYDGAILSVKRLGGDIRPSQMAFSDRQMSLLITLDAPGCSACSFQYPVDEQIPAWLLQRMQSVSIHYLSTDRLFLAEGGSQTDKLSVGDRAMSAIDYYAAQMGERLRKQNEELFAIMRQQEHSFIADQLRSEQSEIVPPDIETLRKKLKWMDRRFYRLHKLGIMDEIGENFSLSHELSEQRRVLLDCVLNQFEERYNYFKPFIDVAEAFINALNSKLLNKTLLMDKDYGFIVVSDMDGKEPIPLHRLSSGEQHLIILYYTLSFVVSQGELVILDEPELSLHVAWQRDLLRDIIALARKKNFYTVVATHSPSVIDCYWDNTIQLLGDG